MGQLPKTGVDKSKKRNVAVLSENGGHKFHCPTLNTVHISSRNAPVGQGVGPFVAGVARVSLDPMPLDLMGAAVHECV